MLGTLTPKLRLLIPELAAHLDRIEAAWFSWQRERMTTLMMLSVPRLGTRINSRFIAKYQRSEASELEAIDILNHSDRNWWCSFDLPRYRAELLSRFFGETLGLWGDERQRTSWLYARPGEYRWLEEERWNGLSMRPPGNFESVETAIAQIIRNEPIFKLIDWDELRRLAEVVNGPRFLSERVIAWTEGTTWLGKLLGTDELLPEALHLAVRSTRYGCQRDGGHGAYSRRAFALLHERYPDSEWAAKTPYWFDCSHFHRDWRCQHSLP